MSSSRFKELTAKFSQAASAAFAEMSEEDFGAAETGLSERDQRVVYEAYLQAVRRSGANAEAEFSVLVHASGLEPKLALLESLEAEQGLDRFGGLAESRSKHTKFSPETVALQCRLAEKRAEHSLLAQQVAEMNRQMEEHKSQLQDLCRQADEAAGRYNAAGMRLDGLQRAAVTWTSRHAVVVPAE